MANVVSGNSVFIDSVGALNISDKEGVGLIYATVSSTAGAASITIKDIGKGGSPFDKVILNVKDADDTKQFDWSRRPMIFSNGIEVTAITGCTATLVFTRGRSS